ncbi:hypothetical protein BGZ63DRAFT_417262 [Mariannaea sp. PMI_226]|nr:hypothetical protein BGZ63DRAFT_417262 [Mariannaea sp. PMI_226]
MAPHATQDWIQDAAIKSLVLHERYYRDTSQWKNLRKCYHPDSQKTSIKITWFNGTADEFVAGSEKMAKGGTTSSHTVTPVIVQVRGHKAISESPGTINARFSYHDAEFDLISVARLVSRFEKVGSEWKMLTLEAIYDRDSIQSVLPGVGEKIADLEGGRPSYKCLAWVLKQRGFEVDPNLPGSDRPGSGEKVLDDNLKWLHS